MTGRSSPFTASKNGVRAAVRVVPKASRTAIEGVQTGADGGAYLKVRVTAAPEKGKANGVVVKLLAKSWGLSQGKIAVVAGATARNKVVEISGAADVLLRDLKQWLKHHTEEH
jgi:hypothetical protein